MIISSTDGTATELSSNAFFNATAASTVIIDFYLPASPIPEPKYYLDEISFTIAEPKPSHNHRHKMKPKRYVGKIKPEFCRFQKYTRRIFQHNIMTCGFEAERIR